jgi:hypothetical protein
VNGLDPRTEYTIKVASVRIPSGSSVELVGAYSPPSMFNTLTIGGAEAVSQGEAGSAKAGLKSGSAVATVVRLNPSAHLTLTSF